MLQHLPGLRRIVLGPHDECELILFEGLTFWLGVEFLSVSAEEGVRTTTAEPGWRRSDRGLYSIAQIAGSPRERLAMRMLSGVDEPDARMT